MMSRADEMLERSYSEERIGVWRGACPTGVWAHRLPRDFLASRVALIFLDDEGHP
jgi:hypothetical protein